MLRKWQLIAASCITVLLLVLPLIAGCSKPAPTATPRPTTAAPTATAVPTAAPTATSGPIAASSPTPAATPTPTLKPTPTPVPSPTPPPTPTPIPTIDRLVIADSAEATTLDPTTSRTYTNRHLYDHIFDPILHRLPTGELVGRAAEKWELISDTQVRFYIRKGISFHNGETLDANAVKFSLDRYRDPKISEAAGRLNTVSKVEVVNGYTVDVFTAAPDPALLGNLADGLFPVPPKAFQSMGDKAFARNPIGSGPWKFVRWDAGDKIVTQRFDGYWRGPARIKELVFRFIPEDSTRTSALLAGDVDLIRGVSPVDVDRVNKSGKAKVVQVQSTRNTYLSFNYPTYKSVSDVRVRQALNYAIDKDTMVNVVLKGFGIPQGQFVYPGALGYNPNVKPYPYDQSKARQLLKDAGYGPGDLKLTLDFPLGQIPNSKDVAEAIAAMWEAVGVKTTLKATEWGAYFSNLNSGNPSTKDEVFMMYGNQPGADSSEGMQPYFVKGASWNWTGYDNPEISALIMKAGTNVDPKVRDPIYQDLAARLHDEAARGFLYMWVNLYGVRQGLTLVPRPDAQIMAYDYLK